MATTAKFDILGANASNANWDGSPLTLAYRESAAMPQTTNGSMIFAYQNTASLNNAIEQRRRRSGQMGKVRIGKRRGSFRFSG